MISPVSRAVDLTADLGEARSSQAVGRLLLNALEPYGARSIFAASFPVPTDTTVESFVASRQLFAQITPRGWVDGYYRRGLHARNPVIFAPARRATAFRWSNPGFDDLRNWAGAALARELGLQDGIAVPCHGPGNRVGVVSFGFERIDLSPRDLLTVTLSALLAHERMSALSPPAAAADKPSLTPRERSCLALVAEGLSEHDIAERFGISAVTVHFHVENGKRKLGAKTRAQAVAKLYAAGLI